MIIEIKELTVNAKEFVNIVFSGRETQSDKAGTWFSQKSDGAKLIEKAKLYLDDYTNKYIPFLQSVANLNPADVDSELYVYKTEKDLEKLTPEQLQAMKNLLARKG